MKDETFNGWTNRETWAWNLVVSNDPYLQEHFVEVLVAERKARGEKFPGVLTNGVSPYVVGDWLKDAFDGFLDEEHYDYQVELLFRREVGSFWRINWSEIGEHYVEMMDEYEGAKV